ncbi:hypothetical protein DAPPUDRAFT_224393 [Daphnia pulex]|uniref:C1q domain-containing protein n=1 Tax=Daphnia pulex TaxID=6669 RepID=E9GHS5_DAPPU|nr:hypothetical protein DAPPUDRAFT_224393 [Daphnia pulex]|eukprot:EFX80888.1 hypothetical protein DAPPUDRAFT_224393 [Daphnia pulex]
MFQHFSSRDLLAYFQNMVRRQRSSFVAAGHGLLFLVLFTIVPSATKENEQSLGHSESFREFQEHFWAKFKHFERKMELEVVKLKTKVELLETKVAEQAFLLKECKLSSDKKYENKMPLDYNREKVDYSLLPVRKQCQTPKTCLEALTADPSLESGMFFIDPDGHGSSSVLHDSEDAIDTGHCFDPGCYSRQIKYNATLRQITMLAEVSNECQQSIEVDCFDAAFEFNGIAYAWWNDRNGDPRYFWSGKNNNLTSHYHTCQCGLEKSCVDKSLSCNCDSDLAMELSDIGVITDKDLLPLTKLNFGRTIAPTSVKQHKLGRMECNGKVVLNGMPASCEDLWRIGYTLSGLYSIRGSSSNKVETVYCDFNKLPGDEGLQTWIGYVDLKSESVYFNVERNTSYSTFNEAMPFDWETLNAGNTFNVSSGIFTALRSGTYFFAFSSFSADSYNLFYFDLEVNGAQQASCRSPMTIYDCHILYTVRLISGDKVQVSLQQGATNIAHFTGVLLEEDIFQS